MQRLASRQSVRHEVSELYLGKYWVLLYFNNASFLSMIFVRLKAEKR